MTEVDWHALLARATEIPEHKLVGWREYIKADPSVRASAREYLISYRSMFLGARVIALSDDLVRVVTRLSVELPLDILLEKGLAARMPFDNTLFTWNSNARTDSYKNLGVPVIEDDPDLQKIEEFPAMIVATMSQGRKVIVDLSASNKKLFIFPLSYWFDPERAMGSRSQTDFMQSKDLLFQDFTPHVNFWLTTPIAQKYPNLISDFNVDPRFGSRLIAPHGPLILSEYYKRKRLSLRDAVYALMKATAGNPRWFCALCALLECRRVVNVVTNPRSPSEGVTHSNREQPPRVLTTFLPVERAIQHAVRHLTYHRKSPGAHDVGGFWSYSHVRGDQSCKHDWPAEWSRRQVCSLCGALRWWKAPFKRGTGPLKARTRRFDYTGISVEEVKKSIENQ